MWKADTLGYVETERDVSILRRGSSCVSNSRQERRAGCRNSQPGTLVAPTLAEVAPGLLIILFVH